MDASSSQAQNMTVYNQIRVLILSIRVPCCLRRPWFTSLSMVQGTVFLLIKTLVPFLFRLFTRAPFAGVYIFHIKLLSIINHSIRLDIHTSPNSKLIATTESWANPAREVATAQGVVHLDTDQPVWVMAYVIQGETVGQMQGGVYTTFSGYLLYSD